MLLNINVVWRQLLYIPTCSIAFPHKEPRLLPVAIGTDQTRRGVCYSGKSIVLGREMKVTIAIKYSLKNDKSLYSKLLVTTHPIHPPPHPTRTKPGSRTPLHGGDSQSNSEMRQMCLRKGNMVPVLSTLRTTTFNEGSCKHSMSSTI